MGAGVRRGEEACLLAFKAQGSFGIEPNADTLEVEAARARAIAKDVGAMVVALQLRGGGTFVCFKKSFV